MTDVLSSEQHPMRAEYPVLFEDLQDLIRRYGGATILRALEVIDEEDANE